MLPFHLINGMFCFVGGKIIALACPCFLRREINFRGSPAIKTHALPAGAVSQAY